MAFRAPGRASRAVIYGKSHFIHTQWSPAGSLDACLLNVPNIPPHNPHVGQGLRSQMNECIPSMVRRGDVWWGEGDVEGGERVRAVLDRPAIGTA